MSYTLIIVESPAKCGKIEQYLGSGYKCIASYGHFRELNGLQSIDIHNNFAPTFIISETKQTQVNKIKKCIKDAKEVFLATDDDREGEAIAWHLCDYFGLSLGSTKRIVFHEVTETALKQAVQHYRYVNMELVNAQLARQVLDVLVGYKLSPILWKNVKDKTSAGRCQTPALRLVYDNYKEIKASPGSKEYNTTGYFTSKTIPFVLNHNFIEENEVNAFMKDSIDFSHVYSFGALRDSVKSPPNPFTTSKLQQAASTSLHTSPKDTMRICQKLYEEGFITYMRTDSTVYAQEFMDSTNAYIVKEYGKEFLGSCSFETDPPIKTTTTSKNKSKSKSKKNADTDTDTDVKKNADKQLAHEAIRPTNIAVKTLDTALFTSKECKMYELIWTNTLQSCMAPATYKGVTASITAPQSHVYKLSSEQVVFAGWKIVTSSDDDNNNSKLFTFLQTLQPECIMKYKKITAKVSMKELKSHYTEAKLVHLLEQQGIGRPSTFSSLIDKIQERGYVKKENVTGSLVKCTDFELSAGKISAVVNEREFGNEKNKLVIKPLGIMVLEYLTTHFNDLFEYDYTKHMEEQLDEIAHGNKVWHELCRECLTDVDTNIKSIGEKNQGKETIRIDNEHTYMMGKFGPVIKCTSLADSLVTFKSVKPDIDLEKLRNGDYTLQDILPEESSSSSGRSLGVYKEKEAILRSGKFGWYVEWGTEKKALKLTLEEATALTLDDVSDILFDMENGESAIIRTVSKETSIRKGKYGDYIFHKNKKMKKPKFLKLTGFKEDYKSCDIEIIHTWLKKTYDINNNI